MKRKVQKIMGIIAAIIVTLIAVGGISIYIQNQKPQIERGLVDGVLREIPDKDNAVSTQTKIDGKSIEAMPLKETVEASKMALKAGFNGYGGIKIIEETEQYIYAVATTGKMKFHDDIEVYFDVEAGVIQYRSASRAGYSDMGLNRSRYEAIVKIYNEQ